MTAPTHGMAQPKVRCADRPEPCHGDGCCACQLTPFSAAALLSPTRSVAKVTFRVTLAVLRLKANECAVPHVSGIAPENRRPSEVLYYLW